MEEVNQLEILETSEMWVSGTCPEVIDRYPGLSVRSPYAIDVPLHFPEQARFFFCFLARLSEQDCVPSSWELALKW
jgi:hypothetical protein